MAIYHCSAHNISRSSGRSATAGIAYRAGEKIYDERTGITHDYTRRDGVIYTEIISNFSVEIDRSKLWNLVEVREKRDDARTAKEFVVALPHELGAEERKNLAVDFAKYLVHRYGCIADVAIHNPSKNGDERNHHAHIMLTTRKAELDKNQNLVLTEKISLEWENSKRKSMGLCSSGQEILLIRQQWEKVANQYLERAGFDERIDHRSHQELNNGKIPQIHETPQVTAMRRKGIQTEISRKNDERRAHNAEIDSQSKQEKHGIEKDLLAQAKENLEKRLQERIKERELEKKSQELKVRKKGLSR